MAIINFEEITAELTDYELKVIVPQIVLGLENKIGKKMAITNKNMIKGLEYKNGITTRAPRIRKMIQYIRLTGMVTRLMATSKGYYISNDEKELQKYVDSLLQRAKSINKLADQMEFQRQSYFIF